MQVGDVVGFMGILAAVVGGALGEHRPGSWSRRGVLIAVTGVALMLAGVLTSVA